MREWLVAGAVIEREDRLLLVENQRFDGRRDWTPPGGVIDPGEDLEQGLTREVHEETGLEVTRWAERLYRIRAEAPDLGWVLSVEVHLAAEVIGDLRIGGDPDGIVIGADWVDPQRCATRLDGAHRWVREPLLEWVSGRHLGPDTYHYRVLGVEPAALSVERL